MTPADPPLLEEQIAELWFSSVQPGDSYPLSNGSRLTVISPGRSNGLSGPDITGAVLLIDGRLRTGPIEIHQAERDWFQHGHHLDPAYAPVILHLLRDAPPDPKNPLLPTLLISTVPRSGEVSANPPAEDHDDPEELLAELAWSRLFRRMEVHRGDNNPARHYLIRLFDALGYSRNRLPFRNLAEIVSTRRSPTRFPEVFSELFLLAGLRPEVMGRVLSRALDPDEARRMLNTASGAVAGWRFDTRPGNEPERRLLAAAIFLTEWRTGLEPARSIDLVRGASSCADLADRFSVRFGDVPLTGRARALQIAVNVLIPGALAEGISTNDRRLIEQSLRLYRRSPALESNRIVRRVVDKLGTTAPLRSAFFHQGAHEYFQRFLQSPIQESWKTQQSEYIRHSKS